MASVPVSPQFDLCGENPRGLAPSPKRGTSLTVVDAGPRPPIGAELARIVEGEIVPRLMLLHRASSPAQRESSQLAPDTIERFALYALSSEHESLLAIVGTLLQQGFSMEAIFLDLLGPTARRLGDFWEDDRVSFADVTIALGRLQRVMHELSLQGPGDQDVLPFSSGRSALFAAAPGEQHTFGLVIIEEFFRRAGWRTWAELSGSIDEVVRAVQLSHFDLFGMTASSDEHLDQITPMVMSVRQASRNRDITVLVGGRLFLERPELVAVVGADAMATDARQALLVADSAAKRLARR